MPTSFDTPSGINVSCFECVIARATSAINIKTIVLTLEFLGVRSITACVGSADSAENFTRWYTRIRRTVVHIDVGTNEFALFHRAMQTVFRHAGAHSADANTGVDGIVSRSTRPASTIFPDRSKRSVAIRNQYSNKFLKAATASKPGPPMVMLSLSQSITISSRSSIPSTSQPSSVGDQSVRHPSDAWSFEPHDTGLAPPLSDGGSEPPISNTRVSTVEQGNRAFDNKLREAVWLLADEFSDSPTLLRGFHVAKLNRERVTALTLEALMQRRMSPASTVV